MTNLFSTEVDRDRYVGLARSAYLEPYSSFIS